MFTSDITAETPGTDRNGGTVRGTYGPPGSYPNGAPYTARVLQGQQAGAVMNMVDFATGQLFDWFVAAHTAFVLIERLPSSVTGNTSDVSSPDWVGPDKMYTQIVKELPIKAGVAHRVAIRYTRTADDAFVEYFLDGKTVSMVHNVGVPLDRQGIKYTGSTRRWGPANLCETRSTASRSGTARSASSTRSRSSGAGTSGSPGRTAIQGTRPSRTSATSASRSRRASAYSARACAHTSTRSWSRRRTAPGRPIAAGEASPRRLSRHPDRADVAITVVPAVAPPRG
jgi:Family of unknown function (DUF6081)